MKHFETTYKSVKLAVNTIQYVSNQIFEKHPYFLI